MAQKPPQRPKTWLEVAVANAGFRKAIRALVWAHTWGIARTALAHDPTADEVAEWWKASRRTTFRDQAAFRECFPTLDSPAPIVDAPEVHKGHVLLAKASDNLDAKIEARRRDASILQLGMGRAAL